MTPTDDTYEIQILANVERTGCHITCVFDPKGNHPTYAYSTGFTRSLGTGEVIVFGLSNDVMLATINEVHDRIDSGTLQLADRASIDGILRDHVCVARRITPEQIRPEYFNSAMWFSRTQMGQELTEAWQLCWPPVGTSLMPWDADCPENVRQLQPALYEVSLA
jgi:hypothetical protein